MYSRNMVRRRAGRHTVIGQFVGIPAEPDAQADPAAGQVVESRDAFRQCDRVVLDGQCNRSGQPNPRRDRARRAQAHPWVQRAHISIVRQ